MINILGVTLARGGSKKIKNKNIVSIKGKPLIFYTIKEAKKSKFISDYIVSTDSKIISKTCKKYGVEVPFLRPKKLSKDNSSSADALKHALKYMEKKNKKKYDYIVELMCTNPLKKVSDIDNILHKIINKKLNSVIAVNRLLDNHPRRIKKIIKNKLYDFGEKEPNEIRRQDLRPKAYIRSGSIYAMSRKFLLKGLRYKSGSSVPYILDDKNVLNIDEPIDLKLAKILLNEKK